MVSEQSSDKEAKSVVSLGKRAALFVALLLIALLPVGAVAYSLHGSLGLTAAAVAWAISVGCGLAALIISLLLRDTPLVLYQVLIGFALRMGLPLAICMLLVTQKSPLLNAGFIIYILVFYMVTLLIDTVLLLARPRQANADSAKVL